MASTIPSSTISTGSRSSAIPILSTSRKWLASSDWKPFAWPTSMCCPTTTKNTARKSALISRPRARKSETVFGGQTPNFAERDSRRPSVSAGWGQNPAQAGKSREWRCPAQSGLRQAERALLIPEGLPNRPWFQPRHLCSRPVHRLRRSGHSGRERGHRQARSGTHPAANRGPGGGAESRGQSVAGVSLMMPGNAVHKS